MELKNKGVVLVTGASTGIGRETALYFDKTGYHVFAGVRNAHAGESLRAEASSRLIPVIIDITKPQEIENAVQTISETLQPNEGIAGIINNAGIVVGGPLEFINIEDFRYQIEVNLIGQLAVTQAFLPLIRKAKGRVLFVGSGAGWFALPFSGAYAASKFALRGMADTLRRELDQWQIPVVLIELGTVMTPIWDKSFSDTKQRVARMGKEAQSLYDERGAAMEKLMRSGWKNSVLAEDVAKVILRAIEIKHPKARYQFGRDAKMAILSVFVPDCFKDWLLRNILRGKLPPALMGW